MPAQREGLAELRQFIEFAEPKYLREHLRLLAEPLGIDEQQLQELRALEPEELAQALRALVQEQRMHIRAARARQVEEHANRAAAELGRTAQWMGEAADLDLELLLDGVALHPTAKHVVFDGPSWTVAVPKQKLREARRALARLPGLEAHVDAAGLHFRWRGGIGGLDLHPQHIDRRELGQGLLVGLSRQALHAVHQPAAQELPVEHLVPAATALPAAARAPSPARAARRGGTWIGQVLSDLGVLGCAQGRVSSRARPSPRPCPWLHRPGCSLTPSCPATNFTHTKDSP